MNRVNVARRLFLRGAGGFLLPLPFLPSLARTSTAATRPRRFVAFTSDHGAIYPQHMYPPEATLTGRKDLFANHTIHHGALRATADGSDAVLSAVLRAPRERLPDRLVAKMNVYRGLDIPFFINHHSGGYLGNYAAFSPASDDHAVRSFPQPTMDQVLAGARSFYPDLGGVRQRAVAIGASVSYDANKQRVRTLSPAALFDGLFGGGTGVQPPAPGAPPRKPVVDKVLAAYRSLRDGPGALSVEDRRRLDLHIQSLAEVERKLSVTVTAGCKAPGAPDGISGRTGSAAGLRRYHAALNDIVVAAFACDLTRIVTIGVSSPFLDFSGDWHDGVAHQARSSAAAEQRMVADHRNIFDGAVLDLAMKLDAAGLLDDALVMWSQESGMITHYSDSLPVVTFGSAGGYFRTGHFVDYRNRTPSAVIKGERRTGILYNQFLANCLLAMGVPEAEWRQPRNAGFGLDFIGKSFQGRYASGVVASAGGPLPIVAG